MGKHNRWRALKHPEFTARTSPRGANTNNARPQNGGTSGRCDHCLPGHLLHAARCALSSRAPLAVVSSAQRPAAFVCANEDASLAAEGTEKTPESEPFSGLGLRPTGESPQRGHQKPVCGQQKSPALPLCTSPRLRSLRLGTSSRYTVPFFASALSLCPRAAPDPSRKELGKAPESPRRRGGRRTEDPSPSRPSRPQEPGLASRSEVSEPSPACAMWPPFARAPQAGTAAPRADNKGCSGSGALPKATPRTRAPILMTCKLHAL